MLFWRAASQDFAAGLKDHLGLSRQVNWRLLIGMLLDADEEKAGRATQPMLKMSKLDVAVLQKASGDSDL